MGLSNSPFAQFWIGEKQSPLCAAIEWVMAGSRLTWNDARRPLRFGCTLCSTSYLASIVMVLGVTTQSTHYLNTLAVFTPPAVVLTFVPPFLPPLPNGGAFLPPNGNFFVVPLRFLAIITSSSWLASPVCGRQQPFDPSS